MIDINTIFSACISSAVNEIVQPLRAHYDAHIESLRAEIEQLKAQREDGTTPNFTGHEVTALQLCVTHETSPVYSAIVNIARSVASSLVEEAMDEHKDEYDHDRYDSAASAIEDANLDSLPDFDDFVKHDDLGSAIEDKLNEIVGMDEYVKEDDLPEFPDVDTLVTKDDLFDAVREAVRDTVENRVSVSLHLS